MKYLIVANGPFLHKEIIKEIADGKTIIALDGASSRLATLGIKPDIILGDFDSIKEQDANQKLWGIQNTKSEMQQEDHIYDGKYETKIIPAKNQDLTDLQKAINYCDQNNATSIDIVCATGGSRMDHHESNVRTLKKYYDPKRTIFIYTESQFLEFVRDNTISIRGIKGDYCGILTAPNCKFIATNDGLAWSKDEKGSPFELQYGVFESTSNELAKEEAIVTVEGEALVIHPGTYPSQRNFTQLKEPKQLKSLLQQMQYQLIETTITQFKLFYDSLKLAKSNNNYYLRNKTKSKLSIEYVSVKKEILKKGDADNNILLSFSKNKYSQYLLFRNHFNDGSVDQQAFEKELKEKNAEGKIKFYQKIS